MNAQPFTYSSRIIGSIGCDPAQVRGRGMALSPALHVPVKLQMNAMDPTPQQDVGIMFEDITGFAVVDHAGGFPIPLETFPIRRIIMKGSTDQHVDLEFRITHAQVEAIEEARACGDVSLTLQVKIGYTVICQVQGAPTVGVLPIRAILETGVAPVFLNVKVPQSVWTNNILPAIGFGQMLLFEMPAYPIAALASLGEAFEAANRAQALFNSGEYDLCVAMCRTAVQPLRNHLRRIKEKVGDDTPGDWAEKIGNATFEWLTIVTGKTYGMGSAAVHEGSRGRFDRLDAQMILTTTVSVLAYAARLGKAVEP